MCIRLGSRFAHRKEDIPQEMGVGLGKFWSFTRSCLRIIQSVNESEEEILSHTAKKTAIRSMWTF